MNLFETVSKKTFVSLFVALLSFVLIGVAHAQVLLTINDSIPGQVVITATGNSPVNGASGLLENGITLANFFNPGFSITNSTYPSFTVTPSSSLTAGDTSTGPTFTDAVGDTYSAANVDLSLYQFDSNNSPITLTFTVGSAAFKGSLTVDLSNGGGLPSLGTTGNIVTGYSGTLPNNTLIGQWEVVPEPSSLVLMLAGFGTLLFGVASRVGQSLSDSVPAR